MKCYLPMKVEPLFTMVAYVFLAFNIIEKHSSWVNNVKSIPFNHPFFSLFCSIERYAEIYLLSPIIVSFLPLLTWWKQKNLLPFCLFCLKSNTVRIEAKFIARIIPFIYYFAKLHNLYCPILEASRVSV